MVNRIKLKPFKTEEDVREYINLYNDMSERSVFDHLEQSSVEKILDKMNAEKVDNINYMILNEKDQLIGTIGHKIQSDFELVIGYRILKNEYRGKGYMTEALKYYIQKLFSEDDKITRLTLQIHSKNIPSIKLAKKFGFTYEGTMREAYFYRGSKVGFEMYSLLRNEA